MSKSGTNEKKPTYFKNQKPPNPNEVFTDPLFPPNVNSLIGLDSSGKIIDVEAYNEKVKEIKKDEIEFYRPKDILGDDYCLFSDKIEFEDVKQGHIGDCYFISSVASLCHFPDNLRKMFKQKTKNEKGFYEIELFIDGKKQIVIVDDYLPAFKEDKTPCYARSVKKQIWVMLLEKSWAKINGGYVYIISGVNSEALGVLTGRGSSVYDLKEKEGEELDNYKSIILREIQLTDKRNSLMSCAIIKKEYDSKIEEEYSKLGLVINHAYSLLDFIKIETAQRKDVFLFKLRNPWANTEWNGDWSDESKLWDAKTKSQVQIEEKDDGIFYMNDIDFFKYFNKIEICYLFLNSEEVIYEIDEDNVKNAGVFLIETEGEGFLSVSIPRENWRVHRDLKDKKLQTYISVNKYDPNAKNRLKTFTDYEAVLIPNKDCTLNMRIHKGNYLIYIYRDFDHAEYTPEKKVIVKITCSVKFRHTQMCYDERDKGFPLLQNIILQAAFKKQNYDPDSGLDFYGFKLGLKGNDIGYYIKYLATPGYYVKYQGGKNELKNNFFLSPYLDSKTENFEKAVPAGKFLIILVMWDGTFGNVTFSYANQNTGTGTKFNAEINYDEIDLSLYTDFKYNIKSPNTKEKKQKTFEILKKEYYIEEKQEYIELSELQKEYGDYLKLFDDIKTNEPNDDFKWGIIKTKYFIFIAQYNKEGKRQGKGFYINPFNIFVAEFNPSAEGKGYTYNKDFQKLFYCMYKGGFPEGEPVLFEKELEELEQEKKKNEEELRKEQERLRKIKEEKEALLKKKEKELVQFFLKAEEERKKKEEAELALKKAEEEALAEKRRIEEEKRKELERQKAELERIEKEKQQKIEEAKKKAEEYKKEQEKIAKTISQKAMALKIKEKENKKKDSEENTNENIDLENQRKIEEAQKQLNDVEKKAKENEEKLIKDIKIKAEEEKKKLEQQKENAEKKAKESQEEAEKKLNLIKKETEKLLETKKTKEEKTLEEIKNQFKQAKENEEKLEKEIIKNKEERKKILQESQKIKDNKKQKEIEKFEQEEDKDFNVPIYYPDYLRKKNKQKNILESEHGENEVCLLCGCNIL